MIRVHHAVTLQVAGVEPRVIYALVAVIGTDSLDVAFASSQQFGSRPWTERPRIRPVAQVPCRSTTLGDVLELRGELHIIRASGFARVDSIAAAVEEFQTSTMLRGIVGPAASSVTERSFARPRPDPSAPGWIGQVLAARARR